MPLSGHSVGTYPETSSHATLSGNTRPQSSHLAEPLSTGPGLKSGISVHKLVSTTKKKKSAGGESKVKHSSQILASEGKATTNNHNNFIDS